MIMLGKRLTMLITSFFSLMQAQSDIRQPITPKISWSNIGIDVPTITIFFETDFQTKNALQDPWLKISIPWLAYTLNAEWAMLPLDSCSTDNLQFYPAVEERVSADETWTTFYVQMTGNTYTRKATYSLRFVPDLYMDFVGYTDALRLAFVSRNLDGHITYAYNNAFTMFYGSETPAFDLIITDRTTDSMRTKLNKIIESYITVQIKDGIAERLLIKAEGDYSFADDAEIKCTTLDDLKNDIREVPRSDYTCRFRREVGGTNKNYLSYTWSNKKIPGGIYLLKFTLKTPIFGGSHSLKVYAMDRQGPRIHSMASLTNLFSTIPSSWAPNYPRIKYSFGLSATDETLPLGIGLYSMSRGYNQVYNSLVFEFKASEQVPDIPVGEAFEIKIQFGTTQAVVPLGAIYHDLTSAPGKDKVLKVYEDGVLTFKNVIIFNGKTYAVSCKVGYPDPVNLSNKPDTGFAFISLIYNDQIIFKSQSIFKPGFGKVNENMQLITNRWVENNDPTFRRHRGVSAFRSSPALGSAIADYHVTPSKNGLRKGDGQDFFFQSPIGPNHLFYTSYLENGTHVSSKTFMEVITHKSIGSKTTSWADKFKTNNCKIYVGKYSKWMTQLATADIQNEVTDKDDIITTPPSDWNFIGGCAYNQIVGARNRYSRLRYRFDDKIFKNQDGDDRYIRGVNLTLWHQGNMTMTEAIQGNTFVWKNIDVGSYQSEINFGDSDAVILDAYVLLYFFSSSTDTQAEIVASPSIKSMDAMYVLGDNDSSFPQASIIFAPHLTWMYKRADKIDPDLQVIGNSAENFPSVMHLHGTMGSLPANTYAVKIFFDFVEPIPMDLDTDSVDCSSKGITIIRCERYQGISDLGLSIYRDIGQIQQSVYTYNSRYSHAVIIYIDPATITPGVTKFSLTFPFTFSISANMDQVNYDIYNNLMYATPGFVIFDNTMSPLDYIDFGVNGYDYGVPVYHPDNYHNDVYDDCRIADTDVLKLDDATANDNPADASWFDIDSANSKVGDKASFNWKTNCENCNTFAADNKDFGAAMVCANWDYRVEATYNVNNGASDVEVECHNFKYWFNGIPHGKDSRLKYCIYCPEANGVGGSFSSDSSALSFSITDFTLPNYSGLDWPDDIYGIVGGTKIERYLLMKDLTKPFVPNTLNLISTEVDVKKQALSFRLDLSFNLFNPLPKGSSIYLKKQLAAMDLILQILGSNQKPPCYAKQTLPTAINFYKCEFRITTEGILIDILEDTPNGQIELLLYGISTTDSASANIKFTVTTYLDQIQTPELMVDQADPGFYVVMNYVVSADPPSLTLSQIYSNIWQKLAYGDVSFKVTLGNRDFFQNDFLSFNLGAGTIALNAEDILCMITDEDPNLILSEVAVCNLDNLDDVQVQFLQDVSFKEFFIRLRHLTIPEFETPGITSTFKFNSDYTAFTSDPLPYNDPTNSTNGVRDFNKMIYPLVVQNGLDGRGQRQDFILTITPNQNIQIRNLIVIKFSTNFSPSLSIFSIYAFQESDGEMLRSWLLGPRTLAITGWPFAIDAKRPYTIRISGVDSPAMIKNRELQVMITDEKGLDYINEWSQVTMDEAITSSDISLIFVNKVEYEQKIIRTKTSIKINMSFERMVSKYIYLGVYFDYLSNEIFRVFNPTCKLYEDGTTNTIVTPCQALGHRLEMYLTDHIFAGRTYTLHITDMPNPDFGFCEPIPLRVLISNAIKTKTLLVSSPFVNNIDKDPFVNEEGTKILNWVSIPDGYLEVWRGFYDVVYAGPAAVEPTDRLFYTDKVAFSLSYDLDGLFASTPIKYYGIDIFQSKIGESKSPFLIGASINTVTTTYVLNILRAESFVRQYTKLPLLNIKVLPNMARFIVPDFAKVFKQGTSLPIELRPQKLPITETWFTVEFVGSTPGLSFVDELVEFSISIEQPIFFAQVAAEQSTLLSTAQFLITPKLASSPFESTTVNLEIVTKTATADPTLVIAFRDIAQFGTKMIFSSNQEVHILYYLSPLYEYVSFSRTTIEAWVLRGITRVGDTKDVYIGFATINDPIETSTKIFDDLLADTEYKVKVFFTSPQKPTEKYEQDATFTTLTRGLYNGVLEFNFIEPVFSPRKQWLLCLISIEYAIPSEDIWTSDGLNCESYLMEDYIQKWHDDYETLTNETIAEESQIEIQSENDNPTNSANSTDPATTSEQVDTGIANDAAAGGAADGTAPPTENKITGDELLVRLKSMRVLIFGSRRKYQPVDIYDLLFRDSRLDEAVANFNQIFKGEAKIANMGNLIRLHLSETPMIEGELELTSKAEKVIASNLTLSSKGFLLTVIGKPDAFGQEVTKAALKDVDQYIEFSFKPSRTGEPIKIEFSNGIVGNQEYRVYMIAFNNNPRLNALSSDIIGGTIKVKAVTVTTSKAIYKVMLLLTGLFIQLIAFN